jgi:hypothetical protein
MVQEARFSSISFQIFMPEFNVSSSSSSSHPQLAVVYYNNADTPLDYLIVLINIQFFVSDTEDA